MEPQITLDGFQLGYYDDGTTRITADTLTGWYDSPKPRTSYSARPYARGSYYAPAYQGERTITITGRVSAATDAAFVAIRRQLGALCLDPMALCELVVDDAGGPLFVLVQRSGEVLFKPQGDKAADFSVALTAPDPRLMSVALQSVSTPMASSGTTGVAWNGPSPGSTGVQWSGPGGSTGVAWGQPTATGVITLDNTTGTAPADVIVTITGPVQTPAISTGTDWIIYGGTLAANDVLEINTGTGAVALNGTNRRSYLQRADWFAVPARQTLALRFTADVQSPSAALTASWRTSYV